MTACKMRRRRRRRSAAADRCLRQYHRQVAIEEELNRLLLPAPTVHKSFVSLFLPFIRGLVGRVCGPGGSDKVRLWHVSTKF